MLRGISLTMPELNTPSAEEFAATVAWPGAQAHFAGGSGVSADRDDEEQEEPHDPDDV